MNVLDFTSQLEFDPALKVLNVCFETVGNDNTASRLQGTQVHCGCGGAGAQARSDYSALPAQTVIE